AAWFVCPATLLPLFISEPTMWKRISAFVNNGSDNLKQPCGLFELFFTTVQTVLSFSLSAFIGSNSLAKHKRLSSARHRTGVLVVLTETFNSFFKRSVKP